MPLFRKQSAAEQTSLAPHDSKARLLSGRDSQGFMAKPCTPHPIAQRVQPFKLQTANAGGRGPPLAFLWGIQRGYSLRKENTPFGVAARTPLSLPRLRGKRCSPFGLSFPPRGARKAPAPLRAQKKSTLKAPPQRGINQIPFMSRARGHRIISGGLALHYIG